MSARSWIWAAVWCGGITAAFSLWLTVAWTIAAIRPSPDVPPVIPVRFAAPELPPLVTESDDRRTADDTEAASLSEMTYGVAEVRRQFERWQASDQQPADGSRTRAQPRSYFVLITPSVVD